jgi:hypothetical protein
MKAFISTTFYGFFNHILALTLIASPWLFGYANVSSAALFLPIYMGWLQLIMAIFADNKASFIRQLPMQTHLVIDVFMGFILVISPFLYNFSDKVFLPQLLLGFLLIGMGIFTVRSPFLNKPHHSVPEGQLRSTDSTEGRLSI